MHEKIWENLIDQFDSSMPRQYAVLVKEQIDALGFAHPSGWDQLGYSFCHSSRTTYDNKPRFQMDFGVYAGPDTFGKPGRTKLVFSDCIYQPSYIKRCFRYSNQGLAGWDEFGRVNEGALTWRIDLMSMAECFAVKKRFFTVLSAEESFHCNCNDGIIHIQFDDITYFISCSGYSFVQPCSDETATRRFMDIRTGLGDSDVVGKNELKSYDGCYDINGTTKTDSRCQRVVLEHYVDLAPDSDCTIVYGISSKSDQSATAALDGIDMAVRIACVWNNWFVTLPKPYFGNESEQRAYYKSWWVIRDNSYDHPQWGHSVMECLPVYKGVWQWAMPAIEWYSDQDTYQTSKWFETCRELFINSQRTDGYIPLSIFIDEDIPGYLWSKEDGGTVQNPQFPWVALRNYHTTHNKTDLARWYEPLKRYYEYLNMSRDRKFRNLHLWAIISSNDSGMDTFPAFQKVAYGENGVREKYCYAAAFAAERQQYELAMGRMCEVLDYDPSEWYNHAEQTRSAREVFLWDDKKQWYGVIHEDGSLDTRVGLDGLFLLAYGLVSQDRANQMEAHFRRLIGSFGLRTTAPGESGYRENSYWRGPSWPQSCSVGMQVCARYYPHLNQLLLDAVVKLTLCQPNIWECYHAETGIVAKTDQGFICSPAVSSNVGAGGILGSIWIAHGFHLYGFERELPLTVMKDYHWAGMRITVNGRDSCWTISATAQESAASMVTFKTRNGEMIDVILLDGQSVCLQT